MFDAPVFRLRVLRLDETEDRTEPLENEDTDSRVAVANQCFASDNAAAWSDLRLNNDVLLSSNSDAST